MKPVVLLGFVTSGRISLIVVIVAWVVAETSVGAWTSHAFAKEVRDLGTLGLEPFFHGTQLLNFLRHLGLGVEDRLISFGLSTAYLHLVGERETREADTLLSLFLDGTKFCFCTNLQSLGELRIIVGLDLVREVYERPSSLHSDDLPNYKPCISVLVEEAVRGSLRHPDEGFCDGLGLGGTWRAESEEILDVLHCFS